MRPEYLEAVRNASWGASFWVVWIAPACVIWATTGFYRTRAPAQRSLKLLIGFLVAAVLCWFLALRHLHDVQSVKERHMETEEEMRDWSSDAALSLAPVTLVPVVAVYCAVHLLVALGSFSLVDRFTSFSGTNRSDAELMQ